MKTITIIVGSILLVGWLAFFYLASATRKLLGKPPTESEGDES